MSTLRRRYPGPTQARLCSIPIPMPGSMIPLKCGGRVFRAGSCHEHWKDRRHAQESRRGTEAVNPRRRERNGTPLPVALSRATVAVRIVTPEVADPELVDARRKRQGVSQDMQDHLIDRAARKRARRSYSPVFGWTKPLDHWKGVRS